MAEKRRIKFGLPKLAESLAPQVALTALRALGWSCRLRPALRDELRFVDDDGVKHDHALAINFRTHDGDQRVWARFEAGRLRSGSGHLDDADACISFEDDTSLWRFLVQGDAPDLLSWLQDDRVRVTGSPSCLAKFVRLAAASHTGTGTVRRLNRWPSDPPEGDQLELVARRGSPKPFGSPTGAKRLQDPAFTHWTLEDFPRIERVLRRLHGSRPAVCIERAELLTRAAYDLRDPKTPAVLLRARQLAHVLRNKEAIVREDDVVLGTTTRRDLGVPVYPELSHLALWPELSTLELREPFPIFIEAADLERLDRFVFPFWMHNNVLDLASKSSELPSFASLIAGARPIHIERHNGNTCAVPDLQTVLGQGLQALANEARDVQAKVEPWKAAFHEAVQVAVSGVLDYARRLAERAEVAARHTEDPARRQELMETALSCRRCPAQPAETLLDALNSIRICVAALHQESMNDGLSLGRLDVLLQPYLDRELERARASSRDQVLHRAIDWVACLMLSLADHVPLYPRAVLPMRAGCRSRQAITLGGLLPDGSSAVCEMTYVILKASEMLGLADPRVHVRYAPGTSPDYVLRRACEVALLTGGGPSIHNDAVAIPALVAQGILRPRATDWAVSAATTPAIAGEHMAHPDAVTVDLAAALELALHDASHKDNGIRSWPDLLQALDRQLRLLLNIAVEASATIESTLEAFPCPLLSSLVLGTRESGLDITAGGARYDRPSLVVVGLLDTVDSLCAIDEVVFRTEAFELDAVLSGMREDFLGTPTLHEALVEGAPKFGDGSDRVLTMAHQLLSSIHAAVRERRGVHSGRWITAYAGRTAHVAFGKACGALPSGRRAGEPYAPCLCPSLVHAQNPAQRIRHSASLRARHFAGGAVFEAVVPGGGLDHVAHVDRIVTHARTFLQSGGLHVQLATVDAEQLRSADADPATFRDQIVSVCGYDAYFVELPRELRERLVREAELAAESHAPTGKTLPPPPVKDDQSDT